MTSDFIVTIENDDNHLKGYITVSNAAHKVDNNILDLEDITFDPLLVIGDIEYIFSTSNICSDKLQLQFFNQFSFSTSSTKELCIEMTAGANEYFSKLVSLIQKILFYMLHGKQCDLEDLRRYYGISWEYNFAVFKNKDSMQNDALYIYSPQVYGLCSFSDLNIPYKQNHMYICPCNTILDIFFSIFAYLVLLKYHFYQCKHCQKYTATKELPTKKKYCYRTNKLSLPQYKGQSCKEVVNKILQNAQKCFQRRQRYIYKQLNKKNISYIEHEKLRKQLPLDQEEFYLKYYKAKNSPTAKTLMELDEYMSRYSAEQKEKR